MTLQDITVTMITADRETKGGCNYVRSTLHNLLRSGVFDSPRLRQFILADNAIGRQADFGWNALRAAGVPRTRTMVALPPDCDPDVPNLNVARALRTAADTGAPWVLFLEDDIDVCDAFLDGVGAWLDKHAREDRRVYAFGANYGVVATLALRDVETWDYPIQGYYGTQAFALRNEDARSLSEYLAADPERVNAGGAAWDLVMHEWAAETWPAIRHFLASCPSFVQHTGRTSIIAPRPETHTFPSWPGRDWSYGQPLPSRAEVVA